MTNSANLKKISILVPVYGTEKYIARCASSLFELSYDNIEYIFVDDCSEDHSILILKKTIEKYPKVKNRIKIIHHEENLGLGSTRLTGLLNSTGDYIWFVDSDDYVERNTIIECLSFIEQDYDLIVFNYISEFAESSVKSNIKKINTKSVLTHSVSPMIWKCFIKRDLFFKYGIFPIQGINHSEDLLLLSRLVLVAQRPTVLKKCLYHYNCANKASYTANVNIKSVESAANAILIIFQFYRERQQVERYKFSLCFLFLEIYLKLYDVNKTNHFLPKLKKKMKQLSVMALPALYLSVALRTNFFVKILRRL